MPEIKGTPGQLGMRLRKNRGISLSVPQLRSLVYDHDPSLSRDAETQELEAYMQAIASQCYIREEYRDGVIARTAVATFTQEEMQNLTDFGDIVAIDPTFTPLNLSHKVIHITAIGRDREIRSGGLVMSVTAGEFVFRWILDLLTEAMPCGDIIRTIVSDDDVSLRAPFENSETDRIRGLCRGICFCHKMQTFQARLRTCRLDQDAMKETTNIF
jgi:hypothetical protein